MKINKETTASLDVDAQMGFTPLCPNELPVPDGDKIATELNIQALHARFRIGSKDSHPANPVWLADEKHPALSPITGQPNADLYWPSHCVPGTPGFNQIPGLPNPEDYDFMVYKGVEPNMHPYGACYHDLGDTMSTGLLEWLADNNVDTVIVGGLATDFCVYTTCVQLIRNGLRVVLNLGGSRAIDPGSVAAKVYELQKLANVPGMDDMFVKIESGNELAYMVGD